MLFLVSRLAENRSRCTAVAGMRLFVLTWCALCFLVDAREFGEWDGRSGKTDSGGRSGGEERQRDRDAGRQYRIPPFPHPYCSLEFAKSYTVSVATTMPLEGRPPVTQVGQLFVDRGANMFRVDQMYRGQRTSFLVDNHRLRVFFSFEDSDFDEGAGGAAAEQRDPNRGKGEASDESSRCGGGSNHSLSTRCHVFYLPHPVNPFCVPRHYSFASSESSVRGVPVSRYTTMERYEHTPLVEQSLYTLNMTEAEVAAAGAFSQSFVVPWRLELRARPDLELSKIADAPYVSPNWRFFGHPMFDELILSPQQETQLQQWEPAYDVLTIDFYDYYPTELDSVVFAAPPTCMALFHGDAGASSGHGKDGETEGSARHSAATAPLLELASIQRFLIQWRLLKTAALVSQEPVVGG